jgi:HPt (histidine-containing phosphotransfer) domain-containing protein
MKEKGEIVDSSAALSSVGDDVEFLGELVGIFRAASRTLLRDIHEALAGGDLQEVEKSAHLVKVAAQSVSAKRVYEAALALERRARYAELAGAQQASRTLEEIVEELNPALAALGNAIRHRSANNKYD